MQHAANDFGQVIVAFLAVGGLKFAQWVWERIRLGREERETKRALAAGEAVKRDPTERLISVLTGQIEKCSTEIRELREEHDADLESAREANEALRGEHVRCQHDLGLMQQQVGELRREVENLKRARGIKP